MKKWLLASAFLVLAGCSEDESGKLEVDMMNAAGDSLGSIHIEEESEGVKLDVKLAGLEPGVHAIHVHEKGSCEAPDFKSAGDHFNPEDNDHGLMHPNGAHAGDFPNLIVGDDGKAEVEFENSSLTLKDDDNSLFTKDGTSIVIHEGKDDGMAQPSGDSGDRIACGEIKKE